MTLSPACLLIALCSVFELSEEAEVAHQCVRLPGFCPQRKCVSMTAVRVKGQITRHHSASTSSGPSTRA